MMLVKSKTKFNLNYNTFGLHVDVKHFALKMFLNVIIMKARLSCKVKYSL